MNTNGSLRVPLSPRSGIVLLVTGVVLFGATVALRGDARTAESAPTLEAMPVDLLEVRKVDRYAVTEMHAGRVVSRRVSELGFERAGRLVEVGYDQGDRVEAGSVLARLDTRELEARRRERVAARDRIAADLALARSTAGRRSELHATGVLSSQGYDEARFAEQGLESQLTAAAAAIELLDVQLELSELRAPFGGVLADRHADEGTVLQAGAPVLRLLESEAPEVHIGVPPRTAARLAPGERHPVHVEGEVFEARLHALLPDVDPATRTVTAVFRIDGAPGAARHGALARVALESDVETEGFWLPLSALAEGRRGLWTAYVAVPEDGSWFVERRQLELIHAAADRAFVRGALFDGEAVVSGGVHRIVPGIRVRPSREG